MFSPAGTTALVLTVLAVTAPRAEDGEDSLEIARILRDAIQSPVADTTETELRLSKLGERALPDLFATLVAGSILAGDGTGPAARLALTAELERVLSRAVAAQPRRLVADMLESVAQRDSGERERDMALLVLGERGTEQDLQLAIRLATTEGRERVAIRLRKAFERTAQSVLARQPTGVFELADAAPEVPEGLLFPLLRSISSIRSHLAFEALIGLLHAVPEADGAVLGEIGRIGRSLHRPLEESRLSRVRAFLNSEDPNTVVMAVLACGSLDDVNGVEQLIALLDHRYQHVRSTAQSTLSELSGLPLGPDAGRWRAWHRSELDWWRDRAPAYLSALESPDRHEVSEAIRELAKRRLFRHETARPIARCLDRRQPDLLLLACAALGHLGSETALPELIESLESPTARVAQAAEQALRQITGADLGPSPSSWRALGGS